MVKTRYVGVLIAATLIFAVTSVHAQSPPQGAQKPKEVNIKVLSSSFGGMSYTLTFALCEIINKHHPYIRALARETRGSTENLMTMLQHPEMRKDTIFNNNDLSYWMTMNSMPPFKTPYKGGRVIAKIYDVMPILFSLNKNIRTKEDLVGKRVATLGAEHTISRIFDMVFKDVWKIGDRVNVSRGREFDDVIDAVRDGTEDVGTTSLNTIFGSGNWFPIPALSELMQMRDVYFINLSEEDVGKLRAGGLPLIWGRVAAGELGKRQMNEGASYGHSNELWADAEMDESTVYEITKLIYEHVGDFKAYHNFAKIWQAEKIGETPLPKEVYHPGAQRFYEEKGLKYYATGAKLF
jgi:uncharacterized protein